MKKRMLNRLAFIGSALFLSAMAAFPAFAASPTGYLDTVTDTSITGWAWNPDSKSDHVTVELTLTDAGGPGAATTVTVTADKERSDLQSALGSADHGFSYEIDWSTCSGDTVTVMAAIVIGDEKTPLPDSITYNMKKNTSVRNELTAAPEEADPEDATGEPATGEEALTDNGPGNPDTPDGPADGKALESESVDVKKEEVSTGAPEGSSSIQETASQETPPAAEEKPADAKAPAESGTQGEYLGTFRASGYCTCTRCTKGSGLTYSGTRPKANHTIAADLKVFPLGTKLMIDGVVYTVEDMGGGIKGDRLDIYFGTHSEALAYGFKSVKVYAVK